MKEEIWQWIKTIAVFYILFSTVIHLIPDSKYERYIRSFMGLLLIYILCRPVFALFGSGSTLSDDFRLRFDTELVDMKTADAGRLQSFYIAQGYCGKISREIMEECGKSGINLTDADVHIEGEEIMAKLYVQHDMTEEQERRILDGLCQKFGIQEKNCRFILKKDGQAAVDSRSSSGTSFDGDRSADVQTEH